MSVTVHSLVRNEDHFVKFALLSVLGHVDKILVYDTGSTDKTIQKIRSLISKKIVFEEKGPVTAKELVGLRQEMIERTKTDFFMLLDGDEIWPQANIKQFLTSLVSMPKDKISAFCRTRNAVGDVYHYLPDSAGAYQFQGMRGHFAMRGFRKISGLTVDGVYPLETYKFNNRPLNDWDEKLYFIDTWYLHATHLKRSSSSGKVAGFRLRKIAKGLQQDLIPEAFKGHRLPRRSLLYEIAASFKQIFYENLVR